MFKTIFSAPGAPNGIAPNRPFPTGYACVRTSADDGVLAQRALAWTRDIEQVSEVRDKGEKNFMIVEGSLICKTVKNGVLLQIYFKLKWNNELASARIYTR